jgi:tetratricopeptide (TPR) repeat protein
MQSQVRHARRAADLAERAGDSVLLSEALAVQAFAEFMSGQGFRRDLLDRATRETRSPERFLASRRPTVLYARLLMWTDDLDAARVRYEAEHRRVLELGIDAHLADLLWQMTELEIWAGNWSLAERYAQEGYEAAALMDRPAVRSWALYARALVHAHRGLVARARAEGEEGLALATAAGFVPAAAWNLHALGFLEWSLGNATGVCAHLEGLGAAVAAAGVSDPSPVRFLSDAVEALVAVGRLDDAAAVLDPFEERAEALGRGWAIAVAARCRALLAAARGDLVTAGTMAAAALAACERLPYPLELGRTLLVKGRVHEQAGDRPAARDALAAALAVFERLGAPLWAEQARGELGRVGLPATAPSVERAVEADAGAVFRLDGDSWTIAYEGRSVHLPDARGLQYLALLLRQPGCPLHVTLILGELHGTSHPGATRHDPELVLRPDLGHAGPLLDARARDEYRARLADLTAELEEAERAHDLGHAERLRTELDALGEQLAAAARRRRASSHAERARVTVAKGIKSAIQKIAAVHPDLGRHLAATVRRGYFCIYLPDPRHAVTWAG